MLSLVLIGTGNVASHLCNAFLDVDEVSIEQVYGRNPVELEKFSKFAKTTINQNTILDADMYLIAVTDDAIKSVSQMLKHKKGIVVHTSGSVSMEEMQQQRKGVFYPLQTFTKNKELDFSKIPICVESSNEKDLKSLKNLAAMLTQSVYEVSSEQRKKLHLAAVFANNFGNHLFQIAQEICETENLPFELLKPLILETATKLEDLSPKDAQTGPARRSDVITMQKHLEELKKPIQKKIYQLLSESIKETYEKEL